MKHITDAIEQIQDYWGRNLTPAAIAAWAEEFKLLVPRDLSDGVKLAQRRERPTNFPSLDTILKYVDEVKQARLGREKDAERLRSVMAPPPSQKNAATFSECIAFTSRMLNFKGSRKERAELNLKFWGGIKAKAPSSEWDEILAGYQKELEEELEKEGCEAKQNRPPFEQKGTFFERSGLGQYLDKDCEKSLAISQINDPSKWEFEGIPF